MEDISIEYFITTTMVLLILSMVTEKITNWIKLGNKWSDKFGKLEGKAKERQVQKLSMTTGIVIAIAAKANIFKVYDPDFNMFWASVDFSFCNDADGKDCVTLGTFLLNIFGSVITGIFLSLGSKFFHDLLDILLQVKNAKRKLNERADWNFHRIEDADEYIKSVEPVEIKKFLDEKFQNRPEIAYYEFDDEAYRITVFLNVEKADFEKQIVFPSKTGTPKVIPVESIFWG